MSFALTTLSTDDARNEGRIKRMKNTTTRRTHAVSALTLAGLTLAAALAGSLPASAASGPGDEPYRPALAPTGPQQPGDLAIAGAIERGSAKLQPPQERG